MVSWPRNNSTTVIEHLKPHLEAFSWNSGGPVCLGDLGSPVSPLDNLTLTGPVTPKLIPDHFWQPELIRPD